MIINQLQVRTQPGCQKCLKMRVNIVLPLLGIALLVPVVQQVLTVSSRVASKVPIALLMYVPGLLVVLWSICDQTGDLKRLECVYLLTRPSVFGDLAIVVQVTAVYTLLFEVIRRIRVENWPESGEPHFTPGLYRPLGGMFLVLFALCIWLANYESLEDAVLQNNLELARRRLEFNLAGAGPNNGRIEDGGISGVQALPLLPLAVKRGNRAMVDLLLAYGADLNPRGWKTSVEISDTRNVLLFAVERGDLPMIDYLVERGANPIQGVFAATLLKKEDVKEYLFEKWTTLESVQKFISSDPDLRNRWPSLQRDD